MAVLSNVDETENERCKHVTEEEESSLECLQWGGIITLLKVEELAQKPTKFDAAKTWVCQFLFSYTSSRITYLIQKVNII